MRSGPEEIREGTFSGAHTFATCRMQKSTEELTRCSTVTLAEEEVVGNTDNKATNTQTIPAKIMKICKKYMRWVVLVDLFLLGSMTVFLAVLEFGAVPYKQLGFSCNDPKISFKYTGDTVPMSMLLLSLFTVPLITMWIVEYVCHSNDSYKSAVGYGGSRSKYVWAWYRHYAVVSVVLGVVNECIKILIGEPRPHFLDTCKPLEAINCTDEYFDIYTCTNKANSMWFVMDASRSFPSGHAASSVCMSIFLVWYLQHRLCTRFLYLKPWLQCLACMWAVACSVTRVGDNRHHWWDVAAGVVLGVLFGMFLVTISCRNFRLNSPKNAAADSMKQVSNEMMVENGQISFADK